MQVLLVGSYIVAIASHGVMFLSATSITVLTFPLFLLLIWRVLFFEAQVREAFLRNVGLSDHYSFKITREKVWISSLRETFELEWSEFSYYKKNRLITLLYRSDNEFFLFPNDWFPTPQDSAWFHCHLETVLGKPH